jgi:hypothetical protein
MLCAVPKKLALVGYGQPSLIAGVEPSMEDTEVI